MLVTRFVREICDGLAVRLTSMAVLYVPGDDVQLLNDALLRVSVPLDPIENANTAPLPEVLVMLLNSHFIVLMDRMEIEADEDVPMSGCEFSRTPLNETPSSASDALDPTLIMLEERVFVVEAVQLKRRREMVVSACSVKSGDDPLMFATAFVMRVVAPTSFGPTVMLTPDGNVEDVVSALCVPLDRQSVAAVTVLYELRRVSAPLMVVHGYFSLQELLSLESVGEM